MTLVLNLAVGAVLLLFLALPSGAPVSLLLYGGAYMGQAIFPAG